MSASVPVASRLPAIIVRIVAVMVPVSSATMDWFVVLNGSCTVAGRCFYSTDYLTSRLVYPFMDACTVRTEVDGALSVGASFWSMTNVDHLEVGGKSFSGIHGPVGLPVAAGDVAKWRAASTQAWIDSRTQKFGFEVCYDSTIAPSATPAPSLSLEPTLEPTPIADRFFGVSSGGCVAAGHCLSSTNYPLPYPANDACNVTALQEGTFRVEAFSTEFSYDVLDVAGARFSGPVGNGPGGVTVAAGDVLTWRADAYVQDAGFKLCFIGAPSPSPTPACGPGTFSDPLRGSCSRCPAGTYSTSDGAPPFPEACTPCPAGTSNSEDAASSRSSCRPCLAGTYSGPAAVACSYCGLGLSSSEGGEACDRAVPGFFLAPSAPSPAASIAASTAASAARETTGAPAGVVAVACPLNARCKGGVLLPVPLPGHWVNRRALRLAMRPYPCDRLGACTGGDLTRGDCWAPGAYDADAADDDYWSGFNGDAPPTPGSCVSAELQCRAGSFSILCGACEAGHTRSSSLGYCVPCGDGSSTATLLLWAAVATVSLAAVACKRSTQAARRQVDAGSPGGAWAASQADLLDLLAAASQADLLDLLAATWPFSSMLNFGRFVTRGMLKVLYSTATILASISWNLNVVFPEPFQTVLKALRFVQLEGLSFDCLSGRTDFLRDTIAVSLFPPLVALLILGVTAIRVFALRRCGRRSEVITVTADGDGGARARSDEAATVAQATALLLMLGYVAVPPVTQYHFRALDCDELADGTTYLRASTDVDCASESYRAAAAWVKVFLGCYALVPLGYAAFLFTERHTINPMLVPGRPNAFPEDVASVVAMRERFRCDCTCRFLWEDYLPGSYLFEVVEISRRMWFVAVLPLCGDGAARAAAGCVGALCWAVYVREAAPFLDHATNGLLLLAAWVILATYLGALLLTSGSLEGFGLSDFSLGMGLLLANAGVVVFAGAWVAWRHRDDRERRRWKQELSDEQVRVLDLVMHKDSGAATARALEATLSSKGSGEARVSFTARDPQTILKQYMIDARDVELSSKLGRGAFGEVFKATVHGTVVVAKTMIEVTEASALAFRGELLLTASLRHPKIVNFVGCCWGQQLTCMLLEWVPNGSLGDMLVHPSGAALTWADPLLALATDVAQGMAYLHGREFVDEADGSLKRCILHRDLKPDNVLVTEFNRGKIADFGTSRARSNDEATMTAVGTPMFAAPELMRGEMYGEKVDVYSFGMTLVDMADAEPIVDLLLERFRLHQGKPKRVKNVQRALHAIWEGGWEPFEFRDGAGASEEALAHAPLSVRRLASACCSQDPGKRPPFDAIVATLQKDCAFEVEQMGLPWGRHQLLGAAAGPWHSLDGVPASPEETAAFVTAQKRGGRQGGAGGVKTKELARRDADDRDDIELAVVYPGSRPAAAARSLDSIVGVRAPPSPLPLPPATAAYAAAVPPAGEANTDVGREPAGVKKIAARDDQESSLFIDFDAMTSPISSGVSALSAMSSFVQGSDFGALSTMSRLVQGAKSAPFRGGAMSTAGGAKFSGVSI